MAPNQIYAPLSPSRKEVRLLEIVETSPVIKCQLHNVSLADSPEFCALSYVWGKANVCEEIHVNGFPNQITKSLADALRHIEIHWQRQTTTIVQDITKFRVWADALCINQEDTEEKNRQVPLMKAIYSLATITFCCLDSVSETSTLPTAIRGLSAIAARIVESGFDPQKKDEEVDFDLLENLPSFEDSSLSEDLPSAEHTPSIETQISPDTDLKARFMATHGDFINISSPLADALNSFTHLAYWKRAWIFQEIALSKRSILFYADNAIDFETLTDIFKWANKAMWQAKPERFPWRSQALIHLLTFKALNKLLTTRQGLALKSVEEYKKEATALLVRHQDILGIHLEATHPKDHIYALLGVTGLKIVPRYEDTTTVASVYVEFCDKQLEVARSISSGEFGVLRCSGLANGNPGPYALPTWVPNFPASASNDVYFIGKLTDAGRERVSSRKYSIGGLESVFIRDQSLFTTSLFIDTVEVCTKVLPDSRGAEPEKSYTEFVVSIFDILKTLPGGTPCTSASDDIHPFLKLTSAFVHARVEEPAWLSPQVIRVARMLQFIVMGMSGASENPDTWSVHQIFGGDFTKNVFCGMEHEEACYGDDMTQLGKALVAIQMMD